MTQAAGTPRRRQPRALYVLFLTEMWERFGFYTMASLFVLYLTQEVHLSDDAADLLYGTYASFIYLTTLPGGILADRLLGQRRAIILGAVVMCLGYFGVLASTPRTIAFALGVLIVGNGLFKPNVSSLLGSLYDKDDPRREPGFTIFYLGINLGAFAATLLAGWIGATFGYSFAFGLAGVGKAISLATFLLGRHTLGDKGLPPDTGTFRMRWLGLGPSALTLIGGLGLALVGSFLLRHDGLAGDLLAVAGAGAFLYFLIEAWRETPAIRSQLIALASLILISVVFWTIYNEVGTSFVLFTQRIVDRNVLGTIQPPSEFLSLNPLFILMMGGPFAALWAWLARRGRNPSIPLKFVIAHVLIGIAFLCLVAGIASTTGKVPWPWLVLFFLFYTAAEMTLSPIGLAMVTELAPDRLRGFAMGLWMLATSLAFYLSGLAAGIADVPKGTAPAAETAIYRDAFLDYAIIVLGAALVFFALVPWLQRLMAGGRHAPAPAVAPQPGAGDR